MNLRNGIAFLLARWTTIDRDAAAGLARLLAVVLIVVVLLVLYRLLIRLIDHVFTPRHLPHSRTLAPLLVNIARWLVAFVGLVMILREFGVDVQALLVSAGVLGLAVGLGAQTLIKDVITGFFLLFEGLLGVGDSVEIGGHTGTIEAVGLRVTRLRLPDGALRVIPNGQFTEFTNFSRGAVELSLDVSVPGTARVDRALAALTRAGEGWVQESGGTLEGVEAHGMMKAGAGDLVLRLTVRVDASKRALAATELRDRVRSTLEAEGVAATFA